MKQTIRAAVTALCLFGIIIVGLIVVNMWATESYGADDPYAGPHGWPVQQIEPASKPVAHLRTVYVERINSRASYVEFNNGAAQYIRNCHGVMVLCVNPRTGTVRMEDGSRITLAKWVR